MRRNYNKINFHKFFPKSSQEITPPPPPQPPFQKKRTCYLFDYGAASISYNKYQ